jgi:hypothetical protein
VHPASDDPATREALDGLRRSALIWLIGGVGSLLLGVLLWMAVVAPAGGMRQGFSASGLVVLVLVTLGTVVGVAGVGALLRTRRWERALTRTEWQDGRLHITGPGLLDFQPAGLDGPDPDVEPERLRLLSTAVWRVRAVHRLHGREVRMAPVGPTEWVLTADGHRTLYGARVVGPRS